VAGLLSVLPDDDELELKPEPESEEPEEPEELELDELDGSLFSDFSDVLPARFDDERLSVL